MSARPATQSAILMPPSTAHVKGVAVRVEHMQQRDIFKWNVSLVGTGENPDYPRNTSPLMYEFTKHTLWGEGIKRSGKNCGIPVASQYLGFEAHELERTHPNHSEFECRVLKLFVRCMHEGKETRFIMPTGAWMRQSDYERRKAALSKKYTNGIWYPKGNWV